MRTGYVYQIIHLETGRSYIGSSSPYLIYEKPRWRAHLSELRKGTHHAKPLQEAWNKYGETAFAWHVLEIIEPCPKGYERTRELWWSFQEGIDWSLNGARPGMFGGPKPDNFGEIMSRALKGKPASSARLEILAKARQISRDGGNNPIGRSGYTGSTGRKDPSATVEKRRASRLATEAARRDQGLLYVWITNGTNDEKCLATEVHDLPASWRVGRKPSFAENARTNRLGEVRDDDARENMRQAQLASNAARVAAGLPHPTAGVQQAYCWVTDGVTNLRQLKTAPVPDGFRPGRTFSRYK